MNTGLNYATVAQSAQVSSAIDLRRAGPGTRVSLLVPVITSCAMYLQGSPDTTSANFARVNANGSQQFVFAAGGGSISVVLDDVIGGLPYAKVEFGVPQSALRSLTMMVRV